MTRVFVYYADGYAGNGDVGLEEFEYREQAEGFIAKRMSEDSERSLDQYIVIEGAKLIPRAVEVVKVVRLDDGS